MQHLLNLEAIQLQTRQLLRDKGPEILTRAFELLEASRETAHSELVIRTLARYRGILHFYVNKKISLHREIRRNAYGNHYHIYQSTVEDSLQIEVDAYKRAKDAIVRELLELGITRHQIREINKRGSLSGLLGSPNFYTGFSVPTQEHSV